VTPPARTRSRRAHHILVTAIVLSPLVALVILVLVMLRAIEQRAAGPAGGETATQPGRGE
jgi:hypothetical protein